MYNNKSVVPGRKPPDRRLASSPLSRPYMSDPSPAAVGPGPHSKSDPVGMARQSAEPSKSSESASSRKSAEYQISSRLGFQNNRPYSRNTDRRQRGRLSGNSHSLPRRMPHDFPLTASLRPEWSGWEEITIQLRLLPRNTTTLDLWRCFGRHGKVVWIELTENDNGARTGNALVRFSPPPSKICWASPMEIMVDGRVAKIDAYLKARRLQKPATTPRGGEYPQQTTLNPSALEFGVLTKEDEMMSMRMIQDEVPREFSLLVDLEKRSLDIKFGCIIDDPRRTDRGYRVEGAPSIGAGSRIAAYKTYVRFSDFNKLLFIDNGKETWSLVIPLATPPLYFSQQQVAHSHSKENNSWGDNESWSRVVDICYDAAWFAGEPIGLPRHHRFIDIGRWTTYKFTFNNALRPTWEMMKAALEDYNIITGSTTSANFATIAPKEFELWKIFEPQMAGSTSSSNFTLLSTEEVHLPYEVRYQLEVCVSQGYIHEASITTAFLRRLADLSHGSTGRRNRAKDLLTYIAEPRTPDAKNRARLYPKRYCDPMEIFEDRIAMSHWPDISLAEDYVWMRKVIVTPSTVYLSTATSEPSNRVLRKFASYADRFLRVQFTDELVKGRIFASPTGNQTDALFDRVFQALSNGLQIAGCLFKFLAYGNSQFRENGAYFFCETDHLTCENIRTWMGEVNHIKVVAKYAARLGQCFSTTRTPKGIPIGQRVTKIPDIERNGWCFSDGVGKISPYLADYIVRRLKLHIGKKTTPSAFQFRLGGSKGLLVTWPDVSFNQIHLRPSQEKFKAAATNIEIVQASRFSVATLNRQLVLILSCLGVPDVVFTNMLKHQLRDYELAMDDPKTAMKLLSKYIDHNSVTTTIATMIEDGFMKAKEPFFMSLLQIWRAWSMRLLREKARIVVEKGAFVFGCIDETLTLRGHSNTADPKDRDSLPQIFIQIPRTGVRSAALAEYTVLKGVCLVGRNPSLHPGDIRIVEAVDVPALHHLRDVVVFPANGDRDIASMCSGGDLDGDDYFVIWDPLLIPPEWNYCPMTHDAIKPVELDRDVRCEDLMEFYVTYMKNDSLSSIALAHVALSDFLSDGAKHPKCLELARLHSNAVDYPKSGQPAHLDKSLRSKEWPHFMERKQKSYKSRKVLGQLYDLVTQVNFKPNYREAFDERILRKYNLDDGLLKRARIIKKKHDTALRQIMNQREINTEFEVWTTFVLDKPRFGGTDYKIQETMGPVTRGHQERFRAACIKIAGSRDPEILYPMIAATYRVTWEEVQLALEEVEEEVVIDGHTMSRRRETPDNMPLISFPWIFAMELGRIATSEKEPEMDRIPSLKSDSPNRVEVEDEELERLVSEALLDNTLSEDVDPDSEDGFANDKAQSQSQSQSSEDRLIAIEDEVQEIEEECVMLDDGEAGVDALQALVI